MILYMLSCVLLVLCLRASEAYTLKVSSKIKQMKHALVTSAVVLTTLASSPPLSHAGTFTDPTKGISFNYEDSLDLVDAPKPLKTHSYETLLKSTSIKGFNVGITIDPVRIKTITEFATPQNLADKVVSLERDKDGVYEADVVSASQSAKSACSTDPAKYPSYDIEYKVDSSRGQNHYMIKTTIIDGKLYVLTAQSKEPSFGGLKGRIVSILESLEINLAN